MELNYESMVPLDAQALVEEGLLDAYQLLLPQLREYGVKPGILEEEVIDDDLWIARHQGEEYAIRASPDDPRGWASATFALFRIVNRELIDNEFGFYAVNGGNDLLGAFLTRDEYECSRRALGNERDWPYTPTNSPPHFGIRGL